MSENKAELYKALLKYQMEGQTVSKDAVNPFHKNKYATLTHIVKEVIPRLNHHGFLLTQLPSTVEGDGAGVVVTVATLLVHVESGQSIACSPACKTDGSAQQTGSAITYLRRYGFSLIGLVTDDDDDGNAAGEKGKDKPTMNGKTSEVGVVEGKTDKELKIEKEEGMRKTIMKIIHTITDGEQDQKGGVLEEITQYTDKEGKFHEGFRESDRLKDYKGRALGAIYGRAKEALEDRQRSGGVEEQPDIKF